MEMKDLSPSRAHRRLFRDLTPSHAFPSKAMGAWRRALTRDLHRRFGLELLLTIPRVPLKVRTLWKKRHPLGTLEKIAFTTEPGNLALACLAIPHEIRHPGRWAICLQGHSTGMHNSVGLTPDESAPMEIPGDRDFAVGAMAQGVCSLSLEQRAFGQRAETLQTVRDKSTCYDTAARALLLGRTLVGERIFDVDRAIDLLLTRRDVDPKKIGCMGNSGGGTVTFYAAALLPRVSWAISSCSFCTFEDSIGSIHHCIDNYIPGLATVADTADIGALIAPKPLVVVNGLTDDIFPIGPAKAEFARLRRFYKAQGAEGRVIHRIGPEGHRFYRDLAWSGLWQVVP